MYIFFIYTSYELILPLMEFEVQCETIEKIKDILTQSYILIIYFFYTRIYVRIYLCSEHTLY